MKKIILTVVVCLLSLLSTSAFSQTGALKAEVIHTLVHDKYFGKCLALLDKKVDTATNSPDCPTKWVSFSCDGTYNSKDIAYRKLDIAQKTEITHGSMMVYVDDTRKHNGHCYAYRVESIR